MEELNKRIAAIIVFFVMFFVQGLQVKLGLRDSVDVTFPTHECTEEIQVDVCYSMTTPPKTTSTTVPPTEEGYIPNGSDEDLWAISFGGSSSDIVRSSCFCENCDFVVCGNSSSDDESFKNVYKTGTAKPYAFIARYNSEGKLKWVNSIGGNGQTVACDVAELEDGSIVCVGYSLANNLVNNQMSQGTINAFIFRYSSSGYVLNKYVAHGTGYDYFYCIDAMPDGGYVVGGSSTSTDGDFSMTSPGAVIKLFDNNNTCTATKTLCNNTGATIYDISVDNNSTVFAACVSNNASGDFSQFNGFGMGGNDSVILKFSPDLTTLRWYVTIAGRGNDLFTRITADNDGGCVVAGTFETAGNSGITDGFFAGYPCYGGIDGYAIKIGSTGIIKARHSFGGSQDDYITDIIKLGDNYVLCGYTKSSDFLFSTLGNIGGYDSFVTVLNGSDFGGTPIQTHLIAGTSNDCAYTICGYTHEYIVLGTTSSTNEYFWTTTPIVSYPESGFASKYSLSAQ